MEELVAVRSLENIDLMDDSLYLHRNYEIGIAHRLDEGGGGGGEEGDWVGDREMNEWRWGDKERRRERGGDEGEIVK